MNRELRSFLECVYADVVTRVTWLLLLALMACGPTVRRAESSQVVLVGSVLNGAAEALGDPLPGARVSLVSVDDGTVLGSNTTSMTGGYRLAVTEAGRAAVVLIRADGFETVRQQLFARPFTELVITTALRPLQLLTCEEQRCATDDGSLTWVNSPAGVQPTALMFTPDDLPVRLAAPEGVRVLHGVSLHGFTAGGTVRLRLPPQVWPELADAQPGSAGVEVVVGTLSETTHQWQLSTATLVSEAGLPLPEASLTQIHSGTFAPGVMAQLEAREVEVLAVMGPQAWGCVEGQLTIDTQGVQGGSLSTPGTAWASSDSQGAWCARVPVMGAIVSQEVQYGGLAYRLPALPRPSMSGACGSGCVSAGSLMLTSANQIAPQVCSFSVRVRDASGQPVNTGVVNAFDPTVTASVFTSYCGTSARRCTLTAFTDAQGLAAMKVPVLRGVLVMAQQQNAQWLAWPHQVSGCPHDVVEVSLSRGREVVDVPLTLSGQQVSWSGPALANRVTLVDASGAPRWQRESVEGLRSPVSLEVAPASSDTINLEALETLPSGAQRVTTGALTVP